MSVGFTSSPAAEQEALKKIYAQKGGNCPGVCAEGHRIRGRNVVRHANRDYCRKCVESGFVKIESRSKPRRPQSVYFIADAYGHVKIGYATSVEARFGDLQVAHASELTLLLEISGGPELEKELHQRFAEHRVRGEWFTLSPEISEYVADSQPKKRQVPAYVRIQQELVVASHA